MAAPILLTHGFKPKLIGRLVDAELTSKRTQWMKGGDSLVLIKITDAGRAALRR